MHVANRFKNPRGSQFPVLNTFLTKTPKVVSISPLNPNWFWSWKGRLGSLAWGHCMSLATFLVFTSNLPSSNFDFLLRMISYFHAFAHVISLLGMSYYSSFKPPFRCHLPQRVFSHMTWGKWDMCMLGTFILWVLITLWSRDVEMKDPAFRGLSF